MSWTQTGKLSDPSQPPLQEPMRECLARKIPSEQQETAALVSCPCGSTYFLRCGNVDLSLIYWFLLCFFLPFPASGSNREVRLHKSLALELFGIDHHFEI